MDPGGVKQMNIMFPDFQIHRCLRFTVSEPVIQNAVEIKRKTMHAADVPSKPAVCSCIIILCKGWKDSLS